MNDIFTCHVVGWRKISQLEENSIDEMINVQDFQSFFGSMPEWKSLEK